MRVVLRIRWDQPTLSIRLVRDPSRAAFARLWNLSRSLFPPIRFLRVTAAALGICALTLGDAPGPDPASLIDPRPAKLERFFEAYACPQPWPIEEYLSAADRYRIDYRFLPVVSVMESTCGRYQRLSNWWGWNSAETGFSSVSEGIDFIGSRLAKSKYYRGRTVEEKLFVYNPREPYVEKAKRLMAMIDQY